MKDSLHIIGSRHMGGAERFFVRLLEGLKERGHNPGAVLRPSSPICKEIPVKDYFLVGMRNGWDIFSVLKIRGLVKEVKPTIVQTYMGRATRLTRIPSGSASIHVARLGGYYKIKGYYEHADAWVGNTKDLCDYLIRSGLPSKRIYHIGNFVDIPDPSPPQLLGELRDHYSIPPDAIIIFSLGRLVEKKGFQDLLKAFDKLPADVSSRPVYLMIAGDGPLRRHLQKIASSFTSKNRIKWVGWQNNPDPFYDLADIFVCASREEPLGNVILEAWSHKLPVIATRTPGPLELITEGENGYLIPIGEPSLLAKALNAILRETSAKWQELGAKGFETVISRHSKEAVVKAYLEMYEILQQQVRR